MRLSQLSGRGELCHYASMAKKKQHKGEAKGMNVPRTTPQRNEKARAIKAERAAKRKLRKDEAR